MSNCNKCKCPLICLSGEVRRICVRCLSIRWKLARGRKAARKAAKPKPTERLCTSCKTPFPASSSKVLRKCEECKRKSKLARNNRYSAAHREELIERSKKRYQANVDLYKQQARQYYETHRAQVLERMRKRYGKVATTKLGMMS